MDAPEFVHRFVPSASPDAGRPALLLLHGTGGDENDLLPLGRMLDPDAPLLSPRGKVLENGMPRFFRRLAEGVFDLDDLRRRAAELAAWVPAAAEERGLDPSRIVAVGFSNGANIAAALHLLHPEVLAGSALLSPMVPLEPEGTPDLRGVPIFIGAGRRDPIAPAAQAERLAALLRDAGASVTLSWSEGGHELSAGTVARAREWLLATAFGR